MTHVKRTKSPRSAGEPRGLDARSLASVAGGTALGITVAVIHPSPLFMSNQHNETLIELSHHEVTP